MDKTAVMRPLAPKETSIFPRDMSDSLPPYASQGPMTPGLVDLERKKMAYLRKKNEVAAGAQGKVSKPAEADRKAFQDNFENKKQTDNDLNVHDEKSSKAGTVTGSLGGLTSAERTVINDLTSQGKNVKVIAKTAEYKTPDFLINGVKTELKSLENLNLNTAITRIQKGFKQGAEVVIIDAIYVELNNVYFKVCNITFV